MFFARHQLLLIPVLMLICIGCGDNRITPSPQPSPTVAAVIIRPAQTATQTPTLSSLLQPNPVPVAPQPTPTPVQSSDPPSEPFVYLWPTYLPDGMQPVAEHSRISGEDEVRESGLGYFVVTFSSGEQKLVVGGGATELQELVGQKQQITVGGRQAQLITSNEHRQLLITAAQGQLFVYGFQVSEEELLQVAESLQPVTADEWRSRARIR